MRSIPVLAILLATAVAHAAPRVIVIGPPGDPTPAAAELRRRLPNIVTSGCGLSQTFFDTPCTDMLCAAETIIKGDADMVFEAQWGSSGPASGALEMTLSIGPRLDVAGRASTTMNLVGDGVARVCGQATSRPRERPETTERKPLTEAEITTAMKDEPFEVYQCAERAWTGAAKETPRGEPLLLDWVVRADGSTAAGTLVAPAQKPESHAAECFARVIALWRFPLRGRAEVQHGYRLVVDPSNPPAPKRTADLQVTLTREDIAKGVQANMGKLGPCVSAARSRKEIKAQRYPFVLSWQVLPSGATTNPKLVGPPEVLRTTLPACFEKAMFEWTFRRTREGGAVNNFPLPITPH